MMRLILILALAMPLTAQAAGGGNANLEHVEIDLQDQASLQRGAELFVNYCFGCHSAQYMRYKRIGEDLGMTQAEVEERLIHSDAKAGSTMTNAMGDAYAADAFGTTPPDLSLVTRVRGEDWVYTYLKSFYRDESTPLGVNNLIFPDASMPHVFWKQQGIQEPVYKTVERSDGETEKVIEHLELAEPGSMTPEEFDAMLTDLVNFMVYMGEPSKLQAHRLAPWVLGFLAIFLVIMYLLKREYWRDVKK